MGYCACAHTGIPGITTAGSHGTPLSSSFLNMFPEDLALLEVVTFQSSDFQHGSAAASHLVSRCGSMPCS